MHQKNFTFLVIYIISLRDEIKRLKIGKKKRKAQRRFKPFLLMDEEFCIQNKEVNNILLGKQLWIFSWSFTNIKSKPDGLSQKLALRADSLY